MYDHETRRRFISPAKLIELLQSLPPEVDQVEPNTVGNLYFTTADGNYGYLDIRLETVEVFE